jgi:hypothetical protein
MADDRNEQENAPRFRIETVPAAQHGPPSEVRYIGVIRADPRLQHTSPPIGYEHHPLLRDRFFYTIPERLLQSVCRPQVGETFEIDEKLLELEFELSRLSGDHGSRVGFWKEFPIECDLLSLTPFSRSDSALAASLSDSQIQVVNERLASFTEIACGYAGWLMTNPDFLSELNLLVETFGDQMRRWGTALTGLPIPSTQPPGMFNPTNEDGWTEYDSAVVEFCIRWRLRGLAGPRIPIPMQPMVSGQFPLTITAQLMRAGGVFNWPDTFPLFARDELRDLLADALRSSGSSGHLDDWYRIIGSSNRAKNEIRKLERRFQFRHFWSLLRERHPRAFERRLNRVEAAFAEYLGVDVSTVKLDRGQIRERLGPSWDLESDDTSS